MNFAVIYPCLFKTLACYLRERAFQLKRLADEDTNAKLITELLEDES